MPCSSPRQALTRLCLAMAVAGVAAATQASASDSARMHLRVFGLANRTAAVQSYRDLWSDAWHTGLTRDAIHSLGVGAGLEWPLGGRFSLGAEALLVRKGWREEGESWLGLRYVEVPLLLRVTLAGSDEGAALYLLGGGSRSFYLSGQQHDLGDATSIDDSEIARGEMALLAGAGLRLPFGGALAPFAELRLQQGLTDVTQPVDVRSRIIGLSLVVGARF
jgi:hypothetical protein